MVFLGLLAVVGSVLPVCARGGIVPLRQPSEEAHTLSKGDGRQPAVIARVVTDRDGKIAYANVQYGKFPGALSNGVPVGVARLFAGQPEASEAVYRLSRAGRDGRAASEDIRLIGGLGGGQGDAAPS